MAHQVGRGRACQKYNFKNSPIEMWIDAFYLVIPANRRVVIEMQKVDLNLMRLIRKYRKLSVEQVAKRIGKTRTAIWRYESGVTDMPVSLLCKLMDIYDVPVDRVFKDVYDGGRK